MKLDLWEEELDDYFKGEDNLETIRKIQQELKLDLPESYISLMTKRNGFYIKKKYYPTIVPTGWDNNSVHIEWAWSSSCKATWKN